MWKGWNKVGKRDKDERVMKRDKKRTSEGVVEGSLAHVTALVGILLH